MEFHTPRPCEPLTFARRELEHAAGREHLRVEVLRAPTDRWPCDRGPQSYRRYVEKDWVVIAGADTAGALYGVLDLADHFTAGGTVDSLMPAAVSPFLEQRGIKLNAPLDARTPSYSDSGDSARENIANMWDLDFWQGYLDRMARNRFNVLSLWNLSPFPSLVQVPEYPEIALDDVMRSSCPSRGTLRALDFVTTRQLENLVPVRRMAMDEKIAFWRRVMELARDRCIDVYLFTWNLYVYGTEGNPYGITDQVDNPVTADYVRASVRALVRTYPLLAGIGVTAGENMCREWRVDQDVAWVMDTYGRGIMDALEEEPERPFTLIHRSHQTTVAQMEEAFRDFPHTFDLSFKYSQAHMHTLERPVFGDSFFEQLGDRKTWLTLRNDDFYHLTWGDADFVREYLGNIPRDKVRGVYMGSDGMIWGKDRSSREPSLGDRYVFDQHWFSFALWGRLSYNIALPDRFFQGLLAERFGKDSGVVFHALRLASRGVTKVQRVYWKDYDFQFYPEACCSYLDPEDLLVFHTLEDFLRGDACPGAGVLSIREYCRVVAGGEEPEGATPVSLAMEMRRDAAVALELAAEVAQTQSPEDRELVENIRAMARLALYYGEKLLAAVHLGIHRQSGQAADHKAAVAHAGQAAAHWRVYSDAMARRYRPRWLSRLRYPVSPDLFDGAADFDVEIAEAGGSNERG